MSTVHSAASTTSIEDGFDFMVGQSTLQLTAEHTTEECSLSHQPSGKKGLHINPVALESPEQVGRAERRNATLKHMLSKVIKATNAIGREQVDMGLTESVTATNDVSGHGGFALVQWVLARFPRKPVTLGDEAKRFDVGALQVFQDGPTVFAIQSKYRQEAREEFVK